ncbi:carbohydrate ABC transporter permease [Paenibacillus sp. GCM10023252]|uniref:carbohydrate ABC transporter permease n=1 Tax=Paenibacillus sp. GCM10023252 TaxID=3252649 RepID=UPI00361D3E82
MILARKRPNYSWWLINFIFILLSVSILLPFLIIISISLSDETSLLRYGYKLIPDQFSLDGYKLAFTNPEVLLQSYGVTTLVTVIGTLISLLLTAMLGYSISRPNYRYRRMTSFYVFFTMLFSGGLVPSYILITNVLQLTNTIWALILPLALSPFNVLLMSGFLKKVPYEIIESAKIDGASEWRIFFTIIIPLSTPALTTLGVFISFAYWNDYFQALLYIQDGRFVPLQLLLFRMINNILFLQSQIDYTSQMIDLSRFPTLSTRMAMVILAVGPALCFFPFLQRFFIEGLTIGSLKG